MASGVQNKLEYLRDEQEHNAKYVFSSLPVEVMFEGASMADDVSSDEAADEEVTLTYYPHHSGKIQKPNFSGYECIRSQSCPSSSFC